jgi:hypothetical protein
MFFAGEDNLAIHTVASAAYRVLSDLKAERGKDEVGGYYLTTIFYAVREYRRGTLPSYLSDDIEAMKWIREIAEQLPNLRDKGYKKLKSVLAETPEGAIAALSNQFLEENRVKQDKNNVSEKYCSNCGSKFE